MIRIKYSLVSVATLILIIISSCSDNFGSKDDLKFDKEKLLENLGENLIIPSYKNYQDGVIDLKQRGIEFIQAPGFQTLETFRNQFMTSYLLWQNCSFFEFGPAADVLLRSSTNTFPADIQNIEFNINTGEYVLSDPSNLSSIGFPAIDYLIFGKNKSNNELIIQFVDEPARGAYLRDILIQMVSKIELVVDGWNPNGDNFLEQFIILSGTETNNSLNVLINDYVFHLDKNLKDTKIGIPLGKASSGTPVPDKVEAFYSHRSIPYALANLDALRDFFLGNYKGNDGLGFDDWLNAAGARFEEKLLTNAIIDQFELTHNSISDIQDPYSISIIDTPVTAENAYGELDTLTFLLKTQMPQALGISISE